MHLRTLLAAFAATLAVAAPAAAQQGTLVIPDEAPVCAGVGDTTTACSNDGVLPAGAEDETVGEANIITESADEIGEDVDEAVAAAPERGSIQVEGTSASSGAGTEQAAPAEPSAPATSSAPATPAAAGEPAPAPVRVTTADPSPGTAETLPFTGIDTVPLAMLGALMLLSGLALRRSLGASA